MKDPQGNECGITTKSIKAKKTKNNFSKVTIKLKGSIKEERRAIKKLNKQLKDIIVNIEKNST